jgi:hypothetical protein
VSERGTTKRIERERERERKSVGKREGSRGETRRHMIHHEES